MSNKGNAAEIPLIEKIVEIAIQEQSHAVSKLSKAKHDAAHIPVV